jgi:cell wall-associated NlpC family hydrolase
VALAQEEHVRTRSGPAGGRTEKSHRETERHFPMAITLDRPGRRPVRRAVLVLAAVLGAVSSTVPAQATPGTSTPATSAQAAELVAAKGHELEVITEEFNDARETLRGHQATAEAAAGEVAAATARLSAAQQQVRGIARAAYTGEGFGAFQALLVSGSADEFVDRMAILQTVAGHQTAVLGDAAAANVAAAQAQAAAARAAAEAKAQYDDVTARQASLQAQVDEYRATFAALSAQEQRAAIESHDGERASRSEREPVPVDPGPIVADSGAVQVAIDTAMAQRGKPYVWAASGPRSFDCSGLTSFAFAAAGISLPHSSRMQSQLGQPVSRDDLRPGDLVFFYSPVSHVGIYIGNGQMVHAPTFGDVVKVAPLMSGFSGARRIVG